MDCGQTCGAGTVNCGSVTCFGDTQGVDDTYIPTLPIPAIARTGDAPETNCDIACEGEPPGMFENIVSGYAFRLESLATGLVPEVHVGPPWWIDTIVQTEGNLFCPYDPPPGSRAQGCLAEGNGGTDETYVFLVWTDDPNAVARNITIDAVPTAMACQF
jgi:hypothetical protein